MIKSFKHKGLEEAFEKGKSKRVRQDLVAKTIRILDAINAANSVEALNIPGFYFHNLKGFKPTRYSIRVSANYRITFEFKSGDAFKINLEDYH